jgi:hypothetical protein
LIRLRHIDSAIAKECGEASHRLFFAVNEERAFRTSLLVPHPEINLGYTRFKFPVLAFKFPSKVGHAKRLGAALWVFP